MSTHDSSTVAASTAGTQFLTFRLGDEEYAIDILCAQEIKGYSTVTPIPNAPVYVRGVMNLRGTVIPVIDLRTKFGMPSEEYTKFTVIIVVTVGQKIMGLVVDAVSDVLDFAPDDIEPPPTFDGGDISFVRGLAKTGERLVAVLDIDRLVGVPPVAA